MQLQMLRACDVCRLVDLDPSPKLCAYCGLCAAWICESCRPNWPRRIKAAYKRRLEPGYAGIQDYPEQMEKQLKLAEEKVT